MSSRDQIRVLFDADLDEHMDMVSLIAICGRAIDADAQDRLVAPPRHSVDAEIVLVATTSAEPVVDHRDMRPDVHINSMGPKFTYAHEIDAAAVEDAGRVASDSLRQIAAHGVDYFLSDSVGMQRIEHLGELGPVSHRFGRTVFLSAGLAGTEVLVAEALIRAATRS